jgi:hypothetical protein
MALLNDWKLECVSRLPDNITPWKKDTPKTEYRTSSSKSKEATFVNYRSDLTTILKILLN